MKRLAILVLVATGALPVPGAHAASRSPRTAFVPVLIYHHVKWLKPSDNAIERGLTVLPTQFDAELRYLHTNHYHPISAARLVAYLKGRGTLPSKPVVLSFDDGYTDMYPDVYPILRRYHFTATFFIVPGFLGTPRYLTWKQVQDMATHGMDIEAHTLTHPDLTTLLPANIWHEVNGSRQILRQHLHTAIPVFAYPYGAYDAAVLNAVQRAGFQAAFTTHQGWIESGRTPLQLPRVYVDLDDTLPIFIGRLRDNPAVLVQDPT